MPIDPTTTDLTATQKRVVKAMLQRALDGKGEGRAHPIDTFHSRGKKTSTSGGRIEIDKKDQNALTLAGLLDCDENVSPRAYHLTQEGIQLALTMVRYTPLDVGALLQYMLDELTYFHPADVLDGETAIPAIYVPGTSKLALVLGENAGGKSFVRRILQLLTHPGRQGGMGRPSVKKGPFPVRETIHLSMEGRASGGITRSFIYGNEDWRSTGENSAHTVVTGIKTILKRTHPAIIYWDEPDIGMSAGCAAGAGITIRQLVEAQAPLVQAVFVTSHSPSLVEQLRTLDPHYLYLGDADGPPTLDAWFEAQRNPTPVMPGDLQETSHKRFKMIQALLKD